MNVALVIKQSSQVFRSFQIIDHLEQQILMTMPPPLFKIFGVHRRSSGCLLCQMFSIVFQLSDILRRFHIIANVFSVFSGCSQGLHRFAQETIEFRRCNLVWFFDSILWRELVVSLITVILQTFSHVFSCSQIFKDVFL